MSGNGLLGIGTSGLLAYQRALQVAGHNIANVGTEGFSRQQISFAAREPASSSFGAMGNGVTTKDVRRVQDFFVEQSLVSSTSAHAYHNTYAEFASQIDNLLADSDAGLTPAFDQFFNAVQEVASDPTSTAARQLLLSEGEALVTRFAQIEQRIEAQRTAANGRMNSTVDEINQISEGIADLNRRIVAARGLASGDPNDLLDQRDQLVRDLAELTSVTTLEQSDGSVNVYIGSGQSLVVGSDVTTLKLQPSSVDPKRIEIGFDNGAGFVPVTATLTGGELGALLDVRDALLDPASNQLGRIALGFTEQFNQTHVAGMDLNGAPGSAFFGRMPLEVLADQSNTASGQPALTLTDVAALEASDYELRFDGAQWSLRRLADGQQIATIPPGGSLAFDGLDVDLAGVTGEAAGDRYLLRPNRVSSGLDVLVTDPAAVAAALPVRAAAAPANAGTAAVQDLAILDPTDPQLRAPVDVTFTGGNFVSGAVVVPLDPSGDTTIDINGWRLVVRGTPADGDAFSVRDNTGGVGDNRGALALADLADRRIMDGGSATFSNSYAELVADVGVQTRRAQLNSDIQGGLLSDAQSRRESVSGVNLDEEAANLMRYQQAYEATAQVIAVAGTLFDTLIAAVRR